MMKMVNDYLWYDYTPASFTDNSFNEVQVAPYLNQIDGGMLFNNFFLGVTLKDHEYLSRLFYDTYGHRQICHESIYTWRNMLRARVVSLSSRYSKLFASVDYVTNPFLTFDEREDDNLKRSRTHKRYNKGVSRSDGNSVNQDGHTLLQRNEDYHDEEGYDKERLLETDKEAGENKGSDASNFRELDYELFTDTPQTEPPSAIADGNEGFVASPDEVKGPMYNEGYLTNGKKNTKNNRTVSSNHSGFAKNTERDNEKHGRSGNNSYNFGQNTSNYSGLAHNTDQNVNKSRTVENMGALEKEGRIRKRKGFEDIAISDLLTKARETYIPVEGLYMDEFKDLFITIF